MGRDQVNKEYFEQLGFTVRKRHKDELVIEMLFCLVFIILAAVLYFGAQSVGFKNLVFFLTKFLLAFNQELI